MQGTESGVSLTIVEVRALFRGCHNHERKFCLSEKICRFPRRAIRGTILGTARLVHPKRSMYVSQTTRSFARSAPHRGVRAHDPVRGPNVCRMAAVTVLDVLLSLKQLSTEFVLAPRPPLTLRRVVTS